MDKKLYSSSRIISGNHKKNNNRLMIVAHPDDEIIFGGKFLLNMKGFKVVCVTNGTSCSQNKEKDYKEHQRRNEFIKVMNVLDISYEIWDFEDNEESDNWNSIRLHKSLERVIKEREWNMIITHNKLGEYGHIQHKKIFELVDNLVGKNLYVFHKTVKSSNKHMNELDKIASLYGSQSGAFLLYREYMLNQSLLKIK